jgi:hypothetical protein
MLVGLQVAGGRDGLPTQAGPPGRIGLNTGPGAHGGCVRCLCCPWGALVSEQDGVYTGAQRRGSPPAGERGAVIPQMLKIIVNKVVLQICTYPER